ncbi:hypothetical protein [Nocardia sp. N2S4-5]|uniref:hypothetical protein n=1 Tax=Nocardia sp. N2S4-5 TaxID=3351565 RepID=UPI0037D0A6F3
MGEGVGESGEAVEVLVGGEFGEGVLEGVAGVVVAAGFELPVDVSDRVEEGPVVCGRGGGARSRRGRASPSNELGSALFVEWDGMFACRSAPWALILLAEIQQPADQFELAPLKMHGTEGNLLRTLF